VAGVGEDQGRSGGGGDGAVREPARPRCELRCAPGAAPGVVPRAVGPGALRGGPARPGTVRAGVDDGRPPRLPASPRPRLLRRHRPSGGWRRDRCGRTLPLLRDALDAPSTGALPGTAHGRGARRGGHRRRAAGARGDRAMSGRAPLAGVRVADFTWVWAGPFCTLQLAHLGAEVIRVESATRLCVTRLLPPFAGFEAAPDRSGYFNQYNQGKKSITL